MSKHNKAKNQARLSQALRANLQRRKAQTRARSQAKEASKNDKGGPLDKPEDKKLLD